jgi:phage gpG-like protein
VKIEELNEYFTNLSAEIELGIEQDLLKIVGVEAVNFYKEGFQNEGFTDKNIENWAEVKRRQGNGKGADAMRKILTGRSGALHDSITFDVEPGKVVISANPLNSGADSNYAPVHNFGAANAGRGGNTVIPARKFIDYSESLNQRIVDKIESWLQEKLKL